MRPLKIAFLVGTPLLVLVGVLRLMSPDEVTRANFDRIEEGMTLAEVEAILGGPDGDYRSGSRVEWLRPSKSASHHRVWSGAEGTVSVELDEGGAVRSARWRPASEGYPGP